MEDADTTCLVANASLYELLIYLIVNIAFIELLSYGFVKTSQRKWEGWISRETLILISAKIQKNSYRLL